MKTFNEHVVGLANNQKADLVRYALNYVRCEFGFNNAKRGKATSLEDFKCTLEDGTELFTSSSLMVYVKAFNRTAYDRSIERALRIIQTRQFSPGYAFFAGKPYFGFIIEQPHATIFLGEYNDYPAVIVQ